MGGTIPDGPDITLFLRFWLRRTSVGSEVAAEVCADYGVMTNRIVASTDGSCRGIGSGPIGWAWFVDDGNWQAGGLSHGTAQAAELLAVLNLLQATPSRVPLHIVADSQYAIGVCSKWLPGWKRRNWVTSSGGGVKNLVIVQALDAELSGRQVSFEWVKGHSGHVGNEAADRLCTKFAAGVLAGGSTASVGPGFTR